MNSVSYKAGSLSTQFIKLFHSVFSLNYVMINTNNKIRNGNPASTGSLAGSKLVLFLQSIV